MIGGIGTVFRLELELLLRGRGMWFAAPVIAFFGVWEASMAREVPYDAWNQFTSAALFVTLILTLSTGDQVVRDRHRRVEGVMLSTPIATASYVWGKYLAAVAVLLSLTLVMLLAAVGMDRFDIWTNPPAVLGHSRFPALGPWPYVSAWLWLVVVPLLFGAALALAAITLTRGQRVLVAMMAVFLWLGPALLAGVFSGGWTSLLDVAGLSFYSVGMTPLPPSLGQLALTGSSPRPADAAQMIQFVVAHMPPSLPVIFYWNRALFATLAAVLVLLTTYLVRVRRRGSRPDRAE